MKHVELQTRKYVITVEVSDFTEAHIASRAQDIVDKIDGKRQRVVAVDTEES